MNLNDNNLCFPSLHADTAPKFPWNLNISNNNYSTNEKKKNLSKVLNYKKLITTTNH